MRSVFVHWDLLERESDRIFADLAKWTRVDAVELGHTDFKYGGSTVETAPAAVVLPETNAFGDLSVPIVSDRTFETLANLMEDARHAGLQIICNLSPLFLSSPELEGLGCIDAKGDRVPGPHVGQPVYGCPNNPTVREYAVTLAREVVRTWQSLDAVAINHVEYSFWPQKSVAESTSCFCHWCRNRAENEGVEWEALRRDIDGLYAELTSPGSRAAFDVTALFARIPRLGQWLRFRANAMTDFTKAIADAIRDAARRFNPNVQVSLEFQLPALSYAVGTDTLALAPLFDWVSPKFPEYLTAAVIPRITAEVADRTGTESHAILETEIRTILRLGTGESERKLIADADEDIQYQGTFDVSIFDRQRPFIEQLSASRLVPYLWKHGGDVAALRRRVDAAEAAGFNGFHLWCWNSDLTTAALKASTGVL